MTQLTISFFPDRLGFEVDQIEAVTPASSLLRHLENTLKIEVVSKKSWVLTDDFEAHFRFCDFRFVMCTPYVNVWIETENPDATYAVEVPAEAVRNFQVPNIFSTVLSVMRYLLKPLNPS